jgi:3'-phosphoadenosine 5'-phosphosulfate sulfotransferase (PAPS reductase)/FAD synthetase
MSQETRHIVALSGGKDSSALALYLRDPAYWQRALGKIDAEPREPPANIEYAFCDTGTELTETYDYLDQLEAQLGTPIERLRANVPPSADGDDDKTPFDHYLELYGGFLPSANMRWCTRTLKIKPFERYIGDDPVINYVGIRADEDREGYISTKDNIESQFPFKEDGLDKRDVYRILEESGVGRPDYYDWRSRSGCYFCFFQRKSEWVGLKENHPELYEKAKEYEKTNADTGERRDITLEATMLRVPLMVHLRSGANDTGFRVGLGLEPMFGLQSGAVVDPGPYKLETTPTVHLGTSVALGFDWQANDTYSIPLEFRATWDPFVEASTKDRFENFSSASDPGEYQVAYDWQLLFMTGVRYEL